MNRNCPVQAIHITMLESVNKKIHENVAIRKSVGVFMYSRMHYTSSNLERYATHRFQSSRTGSTNSVGGVFSATSPQW